MITMNEALTVKTGATYTVTDIELSAPREESFDVSGSGPNGRLYFRKSVSICEISFRTPFSDLQSDVCGTMTHGEECWRVRITKVSEDTHSLLVWGLALISEITEPLDSTPTSEPPETMPRIWLQFYDL
jgi:hypothetical protein